MKVVRGVIWGDVLVLEGEGVLVDWTMEGGCDGGEVFAGEENGEDAAA
jgi:hypothetical protein